MNNGTTGAGREMKETRQHIFGKPKGRAKIVSGQGTLSPTWEYRGFQFRGRINCGCACGRSWNIVSRPEGAESCFIGTKHHKETLMTAIDRYLNGTKS